MERFIRNFRRESPGIWVCTTAAELTLPQGRIQITEGSRFTWGTRFMDIELVALLEAEFQRQQPD
jgi:hypothetical protein